MHLSMAPSSDLQEGAKMAQHQDALGSPESNAARLDSLLARYRVPPPLNNQGGKSSVERTPSSIHMPGDTQQLKNYRDGEHNHPQQSTYEHIERSGTAAGASYIKPIEYTSVEVHPAMAGASYIKPIEYTSVEANGLPDLHNPANSRKHRLDADDEEFGERSQIQHKRTKTLHASTRTSEIIEKSYSRPHILDPIPYPRGSWRAGLLDDPFVDPTPLNLEEIGFFYCRRKPATTATKEHLTETPSVHPLIESPPDQRGEGQSAAGAKRKACHDENGTSYPYETPNAKTSQQGCSPCALDAKSWRKRDLMAPMPSGPKPINTLNKKHFDLGVGSNRFEKHPQPEQPRPRKKQRTYHTKGESQKPVLDSPDDSQSIRFVQPSTVSAQQSTATRTRNISGNGIDGHEPYSEREMGKLGVGNSKKRRYSGDSPPIHSPRRSSQFGLHNGIQGRLADMEDRNDPLEESESSSQRNSLQYRDNGKLSVQTPVKRSRPYVEVQHTPELLKNCVDSITKVITNVPTLEEKGPLPEASEPRDTGESAHYGDVTPRDRKRKRSVMEQPQPDITEKGPPPEELTQKASNHKVEDLSDDEFQERGPPPEQLRSVPRWNPYSRFPRNNIISGSKIMERWGNSNKATTYQKSDLPEGSDIVPSKFRIERRKRRPNEVEVNSFFSDRRVHLHPTTPVKWSVVLDKTNVQQLMPFDETRMKREALALRLVSLKEILTAQNNSKLIFHTTVVDGGATQLCVEFKDHKTASSMVDEILALGNNVKLSRPNSDRLDRTFQRTLDICIKHGNGFREKSDTQEQPANVGFFSGQGGDTTCKRRKLASKTDHETAIKNTAPRTRNCGHQPEDLTRHPAQASRSSTRQRTQGPTYEPRFPSPELLTWTELNPNWEDKWYGGSIVYPSSKKATATVDKEDIGRLDECQFLNDNLIWFYLRWLQEKHPETNKRIYVHNTFFYHKLTTRPWDHQTHINHKAVARWTSKVELSSYDYIVVPVCENFHWYVAIICNTPKLLNAKSAKLDCESQEHARPALVEDQSEKHSRNPRGVDAPMTRLSLDEESSEIAEQRPVSGQSTRTLSPKAIIPSNQLQNTEQCYQLQNVSSPPRASDIVHSTENPATFYKGQGRASATGRDYDPHAFRIVTLDSLGTKHTPVCTNLKNYIAAELKSKLEIDIAPTGPYAATATNIPQQNNSSDCGVFLLSYIQEFIKKPDEFIAHVLDKSSDFKVDWQDASVLRCLMRDILFGESKGAASDPPKTLKKPKRSEVNSFQVSSTVELQPAEVPNHDIKVSDASTRRSAPLAQPATSAVPTELPAPIKSSPSVPTDTGPPPVEKERAVVESAMVDETVKPKYLLEGFYPSGIDVSKDALAAQPFARQLGRSTSDAIPLSGASDNDRRTNMRSPSNSPPPVSLDPPKFESTAASIQDSFESSSPDDLNQATSQQLLRETNDPPNGANAHRAISPIDKTQPPSRGYESQQYITID